MLVTFDHTIPIAENIISFNFKPSRAVRYTAGQFIELTLPHPHPDKRGQKHWFTLSSSPSEEFLTITTKFPAQPPTSTFKQTLKALKPGQEVMMADPMGDFVLPKDPKTPLVFIAGGIGVTPMRSMLKWLVDNQEKRPIKLLYSARVMEEVAFKDVFEAYGLEPTYILDQPPANWKGETGRLTADKILELAPDQPNQLYYLSGPEPMVEALINDLKTKVPKNRLVGDYFPNYGGI